MRTAGTGGNTCRARTPCHARRKGRDNRDITTDAKTLPASKLRAEPARDYQQSRARRERNDRRWSAGKSNRADETRERGDRGAGRDCLRNPGRGQAGRRPAHILATAGHGGPAALYSTGNNPGRSGSAESGYATPGPSFRTRGSGGEQYLLARPGKLPADRPYRFAPLREPRTSAGATPPTDYSPD